MAVQFLSLLVFAIRASTHPESKITSGANAQFVFGEAIRLPHACTHISSPQPPRVIFGVTYDIQKAINSAHLQTEANGKRRQRCDTPVLLGIVASFPVPMTAIGDLEDLDQERKKRRLKLERWYKEVAVWFRKVWGEKILIVAHEDESNPHVHCLVHNDGLSVKMLPPFCLRATGGKFDKKLVEMQDDFFEQVSRHFYHCRKSVNPRRRLARWLYKKNAARFAIKLPNAAPGSLCNQNVWMNYVFSEEFERTVFEADQLRNRLKLNNQNSKVIGEGEPCLERLAKPRRQRPNRSKSSAARNSAPKLRKHMSLDFLIQGARNVAKAFKESSQNDETSKAGLRFRIRKIGGTLVAMSAIEQPQIDPDLDPADHPDARPIKRSRLAGT